MRSNKNNQATFDVRRQAFEDAGVEVTGGFVRQASPKAKVVSVTFGARASAIIEAIPAKDRPGAIIASVVSAREFAAIGHKSNAGAGRVDTHAVMAARGAGRDQATAEWRKLARTRTRRARAKAIVTKA